MNIYILSPLSRIVPAGALALFVALSACGEVSHPLDPADRSDPSTASRDGEASGDEHLEDGEVRIVNNSLTTCSINSECAADEACTQGGHCVNITGERDATAALQADIDALPDPVGVGTPYRLPANASLQLNDLDGDGVALRLDRQIILDGQGALFEIENGIIGIKILPTAPRSSLRDMRFNPQNSSHEHDGIAIDVRARGVRLDNLYFWRVGTGVRAYTYVGDDFADVNRQQWSRLVMRSVYDYAADIRGAEANAGLLTALESVGGAGYYDGSFLGNTYLAPALEGTHNQSLVMDSTDSTHLVMGIYLEGGDPLTEGQSVDDLHLGGNGISRLLGPADRVGNQSSMIRFAHPESGVQMRIPGSANSAFAFRHPQENEWWHLRYWDDPSDLMWGIAYRNQDHSPLRWTATDHAQGPARLDIN